MKFKFAHLADLHLGSFREKRLNQLNFLAFRKATDKILEEKVEFVLICGDIFNNAMPPIELVTLVVEQIMRLKKEGIRIYVIGGSHDYSDSGKSFLELLEASGVFVNTCKYDLVGKEKYKLNPTYDEKTKTCIYGILGKRRELEKDLYKNLEKITLKSDYFNVFMFHSTLNDLKPDFMRAVEAEINSSFLPKGFNFYAGGHVHSVINASYDKGKISYPGAMFPNNFSELKRETPGFNLCEFDSENFELKIRRFDLNIFEKEYIKIDVDGLNPIDAKNKILEDVDKYDLNEKLVLLEIVGIIEGRVLDVKLNEIVSSIYDKGSFQVLKNTYKLNSCEVEIRESLVGDNVSELEDRIINENLEGTEEFEKKVKLIKDLLMFDFSKNEEEKNAPYEQRVIELLEKNLN
ncbi:MAG: DNA repair exonuclease [Candidatus Woesearchaeota archaeon]|jgi:exonuclease SbcD|nr:DNA repair exonuclease [Candidatus Woesearchaeota archaeon]